MTNSHQPGAQASSLAAFNAAPADAAGQSIWKIIFKAARGLAQTGDIITDDLGNRYQVISAEWGQLETTCRAQILET